MSEIAFTLQDVVYFSVLIGAITVFFKTYQGFKKPIEEYKKVEELQNKRLTQIEHRFDLQSTRMGEVEESLKILVRSQLALIDHAITSNGVDRMKMIRKELEEYLINR